MIKKVYVDGMQCRHCRDDIFDVLMTYSCIDFVSFDEDVVVLEMNDDMEDAEIIENIENCGNYKVKKITLA